jgi:hypothetical protein
VPRPARRRRVPPRLRKGGAASALGRLGNPSPRVERLFNSLTAGCPRPRAGPAPLGQDGEAGPRAGYYRPGQTRRQPDASRTMVFAVPSLHWARVHWKGKPDPHGPDAGQWLCWLNHVGQPVARRDAPHPRDTTIERLSGWIRTTGGQPVTQGPRRPLPESSSRAEGDSDGSHSDAAPLAWPARAGTKRYE